MAIEYLEIRDSTLSVIGIIDTAQSVIWHSLYFGVGDFEVYISATNEAVQMLVEGNYISRTDNEEIGIIESVNVSFDEQHGRMIAASGRFSKSILDRRQIYKLSGNTNKATIIRGNVEEQIRNLVSENAISCSDTSRNISILQLGALAGLPEIITNESGAAAQKQVSYQNLLTYTDSVLEEYGLSARVKINRDALLLEYLCFKGSDRSVENAEGNEPIIFSQEFDNLTSSEYELQTANEKNVALIGGQGEGVNRFYTLIGSASGLSRRETWIDASSISKTYKDDDEQEHTYTDAEYNEMLSTHGKQQLALLVKTESFSGMIEVNGQWKFGVDFFLGDIITVQDNALKKYMNARVVGVTEIQDENGYSVSVDYQN